MSRLLVDIHPHIISDDDSKYPLAPLGGVRSEWSKARHTAPWETLSEQMDSARVRRAAVVQSSTTYGHDNSYVADSVDRAGGRITGVCSASFMDDDALDRIRYWIGERGMSGLRLFTTGSTLAQASWLDDEKTMPAWSYVAEQGIPVCVQLRQEALPQLRNVLARFSGLRVILDHVVMTDFSEGPPYTAAAPVYELAKFPGVHLKVTTRTLRTGGKSAGGATAVLRELIDNFGSERMAYGSNWPASDTSLGALVKLLTDAVVGLDPDDAANICGRTALRLYPKLAKGLN
jgi:predicted TIM-barrel fold metal-dependent hydrolase